jgi:short-subunit dehydrogenase
MIDLNVGTLTDLCRAVAPAMIERKSGAILNVASTAAFQPGPKMAVYFATKAFVLSLSEALHEELKPHGIKVSCLCPGPTRTEFGDVAGFGGNGLFDRVAMNAAEVVEAGLKGLDSNRAVVVTGWLNKVGAAGTRFAPRPIVRKIAGAIKY